MANSKTCEKTRIRWNCLKLRGLNRFQTYASGYLMYVEQFLMGEEHSVEAFSDNGKHKVICVTKKYKDESHFVEIGHSLPTVLDESVQTKIVEYMVRLLDALGITWGATHTEIMLTEQGPRVIETHTRLGGDFIPDLIEVASGQNLMDIWARQTLGESVLDEVHTLPKGSHAAIWYTSPKAIGRLEEVRRLEEARVETGISRVELFQFPGAELKGMYDSFSRAAYAIASGETSELAVENAKSATAKLQFVVACEG